MVFSGGRRFTLSTRCKLFVIFYQLLPGSFECKPCHKSCSNGCNGSDASQCNECADGYNMSDDNECIDVNQCIENISCAAGQTCVNKDGPDNCERMLYPLF